MKKLLITVCAVAMLAGCTSGKKISEQVNVDSSGSASNAIREELQNNVGDRVHFALDKADISSPYNEVLDKQVQFMKKNPNLDFIIEGHCDERGTREYNIGLGERRAESVKKYLSSNGIDTRRLTTISYGKERPVVEGHSEEAWRQNRVGITVIK